MEFALWSGTSSGHFIILSWLPPPAKQRELTRQEPTQPRCLILEL